MSSCESTRKLPACSPGRARRRELALIVPAALDVELVRLSGGARGGNERAKGEEKREERQFGLGRVRRAVLV